MKIANYGLIPDDDAIREIERTFRAYASMREILDETTPAHPKDTFELQRLAYERIRAETGLPSRLVTNGIREYAAGTWSADRMPLDEKLMSFKGVDRVSLATLDGRVVVPFLMTGYVDADEKGALSHLIRANWSYSLSVPLSREMQNQEIEAMQTETIPGRVSRLAAGLVATVIDGLERKAPEAVAEQAIRDIDKALDELKSGLASSVAEQKRYAMQKASLVEERESLDANVLIAMREGREDLARAGIGRQDDIDAQVESIDRLIADVELRISDSRSALNAANAARREAAERVKIARRANDRKASAPSATSHRPSPEDKIAAALGAVERLTDLPAGRPREEDLAELEAFGRSRRIDDRLAALREEMKRKD
jgi:phage shock protein A